MVVLTIFHFFYSFDEIHLYINHFNSPFFDVFFKYFTNLGDGLWFALIIPVALLFISYREAINWSMMLAISTIFAQGLKRIVNLPRPYYYFTELLPSYLHYVDGVKMARFHSFPSGHSTTAFVIFGYLAYRYMGNKPMQLVLLLIACLVAFSRVYLSQHFLHDTIAGSFLGLLTVFIVLSITEKWQNPKINNTLLKNKTE
jgi:membrane-associated phospholipid phosphatase